jgi:hypothetical protein
LPNTTANSFMINAITENSGPTVSITLNEGSSPTDGSTYTVSDAKTAGTMSSVLTNSGKVYTALSGTLTFNIVGGKTRVTYTNMVYKQIGVNPPVNVTVSAMITIQ